MKIAPRSQIEVQLETETMTLEVWELTDGGLEIRSEEGKILVVTLDPLRRRVVIHQAEKPSV